MAAASPTDPVSDRRSMKLRCRSAVQPECLLRVGAISNCGGSGAGTMSATSSTTLSLVAICDSC